MCISPLFWDTLTLMPVLPAVGLAFRTQVVDSVPTGPTDMTVDCIVTADGIFEALPDSTVP